MVRIVHGVFVTVSFQRFVQTVILIRKVGVATWINGPHVQLGFAVHNPFGHHFTCTAALGNAEGERVCFKRISNTRHWANHRQTIRRIRDRAVDVTANACGAQRGYTLHRVLDVELQTVQIIWVKLEAEIFWHRISRCDPSCLTIAFVWAKVQTVFILTQVVRNIHVADHWHFVTLFFGPSCQLRNLFGQEVLV